MVKIKHFVCFLSSQSVCGIIYRNQVYFNKNINVFFCVEGNSQNVVKSFSSLDSSSTLPLLNNNVRYFFSICTTKKPTSYASKKTCGKTIRRMFDLLGITKLTIPKQ